MRIHSESIFYKIAGIFSTNRTLSFQSNNRANGMTTHSHSAGGTHQTSGVTQAGFQIYSPDIYYSSGIIRKPRQANCKWNDYTSIRGQNHIFFKN